MVTKEVLLTLGIMGSFVCPGALSAADASSVSFTGADVKSQSALKSDTKTQGFSEGTLNKLPAMKDFLKDVPSEDRLEFLNSLVLKNGHIVSAYVGPLKKTLDKKRVAEILDALFINRRAEKKMSFENDGAPARYARLSTLLEDVPADIKNEFLDNMAFKDGGFASAYVGGLRKVLKGEKLEEALRSITTDPNTLPKIDNPKSLCWDCYCEDAGCFSCNGRWCCKDSVIDSVCDTSCK